MVDVLDQDPPAGTVPYGNIVYYNDGSEPFGTATEVIGGSNSRGIPRSETITYDPRLLSNPNYPNDGSFGDRATRFISDLSGSISTDNPEQSAVAFILGHPSETRSAINELSADGTIQNLAQLAADRDLKPIQVLAGVVRSRIGAGVLSDAAQVASQAGLDSGPQVVGVEIGAAALTFGAIAQAYDNITGDHALSNIEHHIGLVFKSFVNGSIQHG